MSQWWYSQRALVEPKGYRWVVSFKETLDSLSSKVCAEARNLNTRSPTPSLIVLQCPMFLGQAWDVGGKVREHGVSWHLLNDCSKGQFQSRQGDRSQPEGLSNILSASGQGTGGSGMEGLTHHLIPLLLACLTPYRSPPLNISCGQKLTDPNTCPSIFGW